jgi:FkbM family methyltransferase
MTNLLRFVAKLIPNGLPLPILAGRLRGALWITGAAPGPSKGLSTLLGRSESRQLEEAWGLVPESSVVFDVGAHSGLYTLLFSKRAKRVYSFEPLPRNLRCLHRTLELNRITNAIIVPFALAGITGATSFMEGEYSSEGRLDVGGELPVFGITCADFAAKYAAWPDLLKIDVEGAELDLLKGSLDFFRDRQPILLLSTHGERVKAECLRLLRELGYRKIKPLDAGSEEQANEFSIRI